MAYNTKAIITDKDGNPISQYYNKGLDKYEPVEGAGGGNKVVLYNADGTENNSLSLQPILNKLSQLTGTIIDEETRKSNEITRQDNEIDRIDLYNNLLIELDRISQITEQVPQSVLDSINVLRDTIGDLQALDTTEKTNLVLALNEVYRKLNEHKAEKVKWAIFEKTANQSIPNETATHLVFENKYSYNNEDFSEIDIVTNRIKITQKGLYQIYGTVIFVPNATGIRQINISPYSYINTMTTGAGGATYLNTSAFLEINAGTLLEVRALQSSGGSLNISANSRVLIRQVAKL